jgi:hypothetical protein
LADFGGCATRIAEAVEHNFADVPAAQRLPDIPVVKRTLTD